MRRERWVVEEEARVALSGAAVRVVKSRAGRAERVTVYVSMGGEERPVLTLEWRGGSYFERFTPFYGPELEAWGCEEPCEG